MHSLVEARLPKLSETEPKLVVFENSCYAFSGRHCNVFVCFLDASKSFYWVNHITSFKQLGARGAPGYILRIIIYWYKNQDVCIRWCDAQSAQFKVTNGVGKGGLLPPYLFNIYVYVSVSVSACCFIPQCVRLIAGDWCLHVVD